MNLKFKVNEIFLWTRVENLIVLFHKKIRQSHCLIFIGAVLGCIIKICIYFLKECTKIFCQWNLRKQFKCNKTSAAVFKQEFPKRVDVCLQIFLDLPTQKVNSKLAFLFQIMMKAP